jgi:hypothetical protein
MCRSRVGLVLFTVSTLLAGSAATAATRTWTGAVNSLWSNAGNWAEAVVPAAGDDLVFPSGVSNLTSQNDLSYTIIFHSMTVNANYTITGKYVASSNVSLTNGVTIAPTATPNLPIVVNVDANQTFSGGAGAVAMTAWMDGSHLFNCCYTRYTLTLNPSHELDLDLFGDGGTVVNAGGYTKLTFDRLYGEGTNYIKAADSVSITGGAVELMSQYSSAADVTVQTAACSSAACTSGLFLNNAEAGRVTATSGVIDPAPGDNPALGSTVGELHLSSGAQYRVAISPTVKPRLFGRDIDFLGKMVLASRHLRAPLRIGEVYSPDPNPASPNPETQTGNGSVSLGGASLFVTDLARFTACTVTTILDSRATTNAISGTFAGLPEGGTVTAASGRQFRISYTGGNGNDITLTALDPALPHCPEVGHDFTADRQSDILWQNTSSGAGTLWRMEGMSILEQQPLDLGADAHWKVAAAADFDGDGRTDILLRNDQNGDNRILMMIGATVVQTVELNTVSDMNWIVAATGDLDGDGKADILWRNTATGENFVYFMNGAAIRTAGNLRDVDTSWDIAGAGDLNHDGKADIVWRNHVTGEIYGWLMDGFTVVAAGSINSTDLNWKVVGVADFDGDGSADIFWHNDATGETWLYRMNGLTLLASGPVEAMAGQDWKVVATGDYNGDGRADVLWRNASTGENYVYLMDGSSIYARGLITTQADLSWTVIR